MTKPFSSIVINILICFLIFNSICICKKMKASGFELDKTCSNFSLSGSTLYARCVDLMGTSHKVNMNLDECFMSLNGNLAYRKFGNYSNSCRNCSLSGVFLRCSCKDYYGNNIQTKINMSTYILNVNGQLNC